MYRILQAEHPSRRPERNQPAALELKRQEKRLLQQACRASTYQTYLNQSLLFQKEKHFLQGQHFLQKQQRFRPVLEKEAQDQNSEFQRCPEIPAVRMSQQNLRLCPPLLPEFHQHFPLTEFLLPVRLLRLHRFLQFHQANLHSCLLRHRQMQIRQQMFSLQAVVFEQALVSEVQQRQV